MTSTDSTAFRKGFVYTLIVLYCVYALFQIGLAGLLFSLAIGLILHSFDFPLELLTAFIILSGLAWKIIVHGKKEGFQAPTGTGQSVQAIAKKIEQVQQKNLYKDATGLLSSQYVEGFADADASTSGTLPPSSTESSSEKEKEKNDTPPSAPSTTGGPASTNQPTATAALANALPDPATTASANAATTSGFVDKHMNGMFKLGSIPPDAVGGSHIDVGTTLMNALNSLKPDQVKQMTNDTKQLMETQKSLVGMLSTIKPMLQDGKQLMETFNGMFGNQ
jgi:hypothetical protein